MPRGRYRYDFDDGYDPFPPYVSAAERRAQAEARIATLRKKGQTPAPVRIAGSAIAKTFWGKAWCGNLESYSDFANRLPRGRTYVRSGAVVDLKIEHDTILALVQGTSLYEVRIKVSKLPAARWRAFKARCAGAGRIDSMVALLRGTIGESLLAIVTDRTHGLFPAPKEITLECSCPDSASMCKHVAATLYGVGARLDQKPELFFALRQVDPLDLVGAPPAAATAKPKKALAETELAGIFGIEIAGADPGVKKAAARASTKRRR